ncbi:MAG TPA: methionyl-tRNA formyltransferase, partial [Candidatus Sulfotelmatobacter sp.]|nr:methionyl-tRNA formyltransferase [Candidatus Sulfotelmatobacter sp.]
EDMAHNKNAGELSVHGDNLRLICGGGTALQILTLQPEGKKAMSAREFINGYRPAAGERLG